MTDSQRAEEHLRVIRELMERATIYRAISAPTALVGGLLSLSVAAIPHSFWIPLAGPAHAFQLAWGTALVLTLVANTIFIARDATRRGDPLISPGMKLALRAVLPAMLTGGLCFVLLRTATLPPFLMLFYGLALLATGHFAPRSIVYLGLAFLGVGCALLVWIVTCGAFPLGEAVAMGATFGVFHLIYAAATWPRP